VEIDCSTHLYSSRRSSAGALVRQRALRVAARIVMRRLKMGWKEEHAAFQAEFGKESDRAAVILASAKVDELLRLAIVKRLLPSPTERDHMLEPEGPIGSSGARINLSYRLGLIDAAFARALHLLRRIRNDFAHESAGGRLDSGPHADRVRELALPWRTILEQVQELDPGKWDTPRKHFEFMVGYILVRLNHVVKHTDEIEPPPHPIGRFMERVKDPD
jgi:hypothetical protein